MHKNQSKKSAIISDSPYSSMDPSVSRGPRLRARRPRSRAGSAASSDRAWPSVRRPPSRCCASGDVSVARSGRPRPGPPSMPERRPDSLATSRSPSMTSCNDIHIYVPRSFHFHAFMHYVIAVVEKSTERIKNIITQIRGCRSCSRPAPRPWATSPNRCPGPSSQCDTRICASTILLLSTCHRSQHCNEEKEES